MELKYISNLGCEKYSCKAKCPAWVSPQELLAECRLDTHHKERGQWMGSNKTDVKSVAEINLYHFTNLPHN